MTQSQIEKSLKNVDRLIKEKTKVNTIINIERVNIRAYNFKSHTMVSFTLSCIPFISWSIEYKDKIIYNIGWSECGYDKFFSKDFMTKQEFYELLQLLQLELLS